MVLHPVICIGCFDMLNTACDFRNKCLQTEMKPNEIGDFVAVNVKEEVEDEKPSCEDLEDYNVYVKQETNDVIVYCDSDVKIKTEIN